MEPVVADPAVDHRVDRHGDLQRRMGIEEAHQHQKPRVGGADHADPAVRLRHVLRQPIDGVPGVGRMIDGGRIQRPAQRAVHHVVALRAVLAADVLKDPDVAREGHDVVGRRDHRLQSGARRAGGRLVGVVGRAGEQDRHLAGAARSHRSHRSLRSLRDQDHRVAASRRRASRSRPRAGGGRSSLPRP